VDPPHGVKLVPVSTAAEMDKALSAAVAKADLVVMAAAVADYRPARPSKEKLKRGTGKLSLELEPNSDILAGLAAKRAKGQVFVGFALETSGGLERARAKLAGKGVDLIVLHSPRAGLGGETNQVTLVEPQNELKLPTQSKREVAEAILDRAIEIRAGQATPARAGRSRAGRPPARAAKGRKSR
jgi:phosphopantothenoylcysteine decarboxylase/phosphopantothenate--cysteine ligase